MIAAKLGIPVVSDFRPADMAAGGKGAPLVPFLDYVLYRHRRFGRIVQNIGGIGNLTAIPPRATPEDVVAFDTGPGNMVIDAVAERLFPLPFDRNGRLAGRGDPIEAVLQQLMRHPFFRQKPPKTTGREQFGREFVGEFLHLCARSEEHDVIATATALTARSIGKAVRAFVLPLDEEFDATNYSAPHAVSRIRHLRRRHEERDAHGDDPRRACALEDARADQRRLRPAFGSQGGGGLCLAGIPDMAAHPGEHSIGHRRKAPGDSGQDQLCLEACGSNPKRLVIPGEVEGPRPTTLPLST